ncbi:MAG: T9SS type A sorting domain-containing protein [Bacteroidaceae bacterium]|nr:T9SS type A sorting domain-containing protein [Bacteroidaceae bacterium]
MKKILYTLFLAAFATNINAQLVVDSIGRVGVGTETPKSILSVGGKGDSITAISCHPLDIQRYGLRVSKQSYNTSSAVYGVFSSLRNTNSGCYGVTAHVLGNNNMNSLQTVIGIMGRAGWARTSVGVFGGKPLNSWTPVNFAGVYGSELGLNPSFPNYSGSYAGFFEGKVRVTNGIYATLLSPSASSLPSGECGTIILSGREKSVTDKLSQVQAIQFLRYDPTKETKTEKTSPVETDVENMSPDELDSLAANTEEKPEQYLSPIQYGLAADQLKAVYPELVYEDANGNVSINYVEMIPLLVQSIKELSQELAELKGKTTRKAKSETTGIEETPNDIDMVRMDQNKPNPFSESTVIGLNIPEKTQKASIFIYDLSGKQIQNFPVAERGETNITVYAGDLSAGMYIYTLVVDGKVVVTRRMIVEK